MCVGYTHSGKTTFSKKLAKNQKNTVLIDNDEIAAFLNSKYPAVTFSDYNKIKRDFTEPNLKFLVFKDLLNYSLRADVNVVLSNGNLGKDIRDLVTNYAKKYSYQVIMIYFKISKETIKSRIEKTTKGSKSFLLSKNWSEVLIKQEKYAELPPSKTKIHHYFEIEKDADYKKVLSEIKTILC